MKNVDSYHNYYLKNVILLLADVFEKFIDTCLKFYKLDPCHYFTSAGVSQDMMLKMIGVKLKKYLTCPYSLKKEQDEEFLTFIKDKGKQITNT